jgi:hypothetical protein
VVQKLDTAEGGFFTPDGDTVLAHNFLKGMAVNLKVSSSSSSSSSSTSSSSSSRR